MCNLLTFLKRCNSITSIFTRIISIIDKFRGSLIQHNGVYSVAENIQFIVIESKEKQQDTLVWGNSWRFGLCTQLYLHNTLHPTQLIQSAEKMGQQKDANTQISSQ